jgi:hypothetical protein
MFVLYFVVLVIIAKNWILAWLNNDFKDEVYADLFALYSLTAQEQVKLYERFSSKRYNYKAIFSNKKMLRIYMEKRIKIFLENLIYAYKGNINGMFNNTITQVEHSFSFLVIKNLFWLVLYFSIGLFASKNVSFHKHELLVMVVVTLSLIILLFMANLRSEKKIISILNVLDQ